MLFKKKVIIAEAQYGLLFQDEQFVRVLTAGVHEFFDWKNRYRIEVITLKTT